MLLVDIGNSRCKLALFEAGKLKELAASAYLKMKTNDRAEWVATQIVKQWQPSVSVRVVSVLGEVFWQQLCEQLQRAGICDVKDFATANLSGIQIGYKNPAELGMDRQAAMLGALELQLGDVIIIDAGTAITLDAMSAKGCHLGGLIMPGRMSLLQALNQSAPQLPPVHEGDTVLLANNTRDGIYSGCALLLQQGLEGVIRQTMRRLPQATVVLTGGDASWLQGQLAMPVMLDHQLVLRGVWRAFR